MGPRGVFETTSSAEADGSNRIAGVRFDERRMYVLLQDGREISVPLWWYPRLLRATPEQRNTANYNIDNNLNWLRGDHSLKFGFSWVRVTNWLVDSRIVPQVSIGLSTNAVNDPALTTLFTPANFPSATNNDMDSARALYALLTGRISSLPGTGQLNNEGTEYIFNGPARDSERQDSYGLYAQDSWRWKPNLTVTAGLRYQLQMPMIPTIGRFTGSQLRDVCGMSGIGVGQDVHVLIESLVHPAVPGLVVADGHWPPLVTRFVVGRAAVGVDDHRIFHARARSILQRELREWIREPELRVELERVAGDRSGVAV